MHNIPIVYMSVLYNKYRVSYMVYNPYIYFWGEDEHGIRLKSSKFNVQLRVVKPTNRERRCKYNAVGDAMPRHLYMSIQL